MELSQTVEDEQELKQELASRWASRGIPGIDRIDRQTADD